MVLDLAEVVSETDRLWAPRLGLSQRCRYLGGDMFREVPPADVYVLKSVLHNWSDDECVRILTNLRRAVIGRRHLLEMELRHSGFLRDGGSEMRPADIGTQRFSPALVAD